AESSGEVVGGGFADNENVHVALGALFTSGDGAVDEGEVDFLPQRFQGVLQHVEQAEGLGHEAADLRGQRAFKVSLKIDPVSILAGIEDSGGREALQGALEARGRKPQVLG